MKVKDEIKSAGYRIGAVAKLTGISPDALRIWERRYGCIVPLRSPGGGRLYSADDIARLQLMKLLVDRRYIIVGWWYRFSLSGEMELSSELLLLSDV